MRHCCNLCNTPKFTVWKVCLLLTRIMCCLRLEILVFEVILSNKTSPLKVKFDYLLETMEGKKHDKISLGLQSWFQSHDSCTFRHILRSQITRPYTLIGPLPLMKLSTFQGEICKIYKLNEVFQESEKYNCESSIGQHLIVNPECAKTYRNDNFWIVGQARSSFHLSVLESVYIKIQNPILCRQKEFVFSLVLFK